ncbi:MAG: hypothetical protein ACYDDF_01650 [Thermoplasmatota archaeon]
MAVVFLLGPSEWDPTRGPAPKQSPMEVRRALQTILARDHVVFLMEDTPDRAGEDLVDKFDRLIRDREVTDILVYWPPRAKMQTTYDELILLRDRLDRPSLPRIWILHHASVAIIRRGKFEVLEPGGRSRYLSAVARLGVHPIEWTDDQELMTKAAFIAAELA